MGYSLIDVFSGAGGLTQGFVTAGFTPVFAVEKDPDAAQTYRANFGDHVHVGPIESLHSDAFPEARVIVGGPPCQGFSPLGKMNGGGANTELNGLWREYFRVVRIVEPDVFVLENVPQFLRSAEYAALRRQAEADDYEVTAGILNAVEFGVPQRTSPCAGCGIAGRDAAASEAHRPDGRDGRRSDRATAGTDGVR